MTDVAPARPTRFRTGGLSQRKPTRFQWVPDQSARADLARDLGLLAVHRLDFSGQIDPSGRDEFRLEGRLVAVVDQACIVSLAPVRAEISDRVIRRYVAGLALPEGDEAEMPEDDSIDALPDTLDLVEVATEALLLALPLYPRAAGAEFGAQDLPPPGAAPIDSAAVKPFAGLAGLAERMKSDPETGGGKTG